MHYLGIEAALKNQPLLDPAFIPFGVWRREYEKEASRPFALAVERDHGAVSVFETKLRGEDFAEANYRYIERFVKLLLWSAGGLRVWLCGDDALAKRLQAEYCPDGRRAFDVGFMQDVFEVPFEIVICDWAHLPKPNEKPIRVGGHTNGCRIGFDAGGSDRKVSAVIDGQTVYSEEVVWHPKTSEDLSYQYDGIVSAFKTAASKLPRVDGIGVSSAGTFVGNSPMVSSLFLKIPRAQREQVKSIYDRAAKEIGDVPIVVANEQRKGRRKVTTVSGLEAFCIDLAAFSEALRVRCAASSTVHKTPSGSESFVLVGGLAQKQVVDLLTTKYRVPKKYIKVVS